MNIYMYIYIHMSIDVYLDTNVYIYVYTHIYIDVYTYMCIYVCKCICIYIYLPQNPLLTKLRGAERVRRPPRTAGTSVGLGTCEDKFRTQSNIKMCVYVYIYICMHIYI